MSSHVCHEENQMPVVAINTSNSHVLFAFTNTLACSYSFATEEREKQREKEKTMKT